MKKKLLLFKETGRLERNRQKKTRYVRRVYDTNKFHCRDENLIISYHLDDFQSNINLDYSQFLSFSSVKFIKNFRGRI